MSGFESIVAQNPDVLVEPLDFSLRGPAASYISAREEVTFFSSQNLVSPNGVKVARFQLGSTGFLDLGSLHFSMLLTNKSETQELQPLACEAHCLFSRMIVKAGGSQIENIELFPVVEEYTRRLLPHEKRLNLSGQFLGADKATGANGYDLASHTLAAGTSKRILFRPMSSAILNMRKYWPGLLLGASGLEFSLELALPNEACLASLSQDYELSDLRVLCNQITLVSDLANSYTSLLLDGKSVFLNLDMVENTQHFLPGTSSKFSVSSARQFSRLNTLVVIMGQAPGALAETSQILNHYLPASARETIQSHLVISGQRQPLFSNRGAAEHWVRFLRGTGVYANIGTSTSISHEGFSGGNGTPGRAFSCVFDCERLASHAEHTGIPIDSGGVINIFIEGCGNQPSEYVSNVILQHHFSAQLEIRDSGCTLYT